MAVKGTIVQALSYRVADPQTARLSLTELRELDSSTDQEAQETSMQLALCVGATATRELFDEIVETLRDGRLPGPEREILLEDLPRLRHPDTVAVLLTSLDDAALRPTAIATLGEIADAQAVPALERFLDDPEVGDYARLAIEDIERRTS